MMLVMLFTKEAQLGAGDVWLLGVRPIIGICGTLTIVL